MNKHRLRMGKNEPKKINSPMLDYSNFSNTYYGNTNGLFNESFNEPDEVPYGSICSCNLANGGSGICGCTMANKMVPNPKKNVKMVDNYTISTNVTTMVNNVNQYDELFKLFDFLQEEAKNKRLLADKSNDPNYYYGMVSAYLDIQSRILKTINKK